MFGSQTIKKHTNSCYLNPINIRYCKICNKPIKNWKTSKGTCSYSCSNTLFRSGENNPNYTGNSYIIICSKHHEMKCVVCGEKEVIDVHHLDENRENNDPKNLIPLCPTHHAYIHRGKKYLIEKYLPSIG